MGKAVSPARSAAYKILYDVIENKAYSNVSVNNHIDLSIKNEADRRLANAIAFGTLKKRTRLEKSLGKLSAKPIAELDAGVRIILLMSLYQILFMDKLPEYAIVNDAVNLARFGSERASTSFVNGVLRNALRQKNELLDTETEFYEYMRAEYNLPRFVADIYLQSFSKDELTELMRKFDEPAKLYLRVNTLKKNPDHLIARLEGLGIRAEKTYVPNTLLVRSTRNVFMTPAFRDGDFFVQDISGAISSFVLAPKKNERILDLCAAPGAKSFGAYFSEPSIELLSCDINSKKVDLMKRTALQLGISRFRGVKRDGRFVREGEENLYDRVICDAPCSGLGVVGRKPEILYNVTPEHLASLVKLQLELLSCASKYLKAGGTLIYSTCTLSAEENERNVARLLEADPTLTREPIALPFALNCPHPEMDRGELRLTPISDESDGFFIAALRKRTI